MGVNEHRPDGAGAFEHASEKGGGEKRRGSGRIGKGKIFRTLLLS